MRCLILEAVRRGDFLSAMVTCSVSTKNQITLLISLGNGGSQKNYYHVSEIIFFAQENRYTLLVLKSRLGYNISCITARTNFAVLGVCTAAYFEAVHYVYATSRRSEEPHHRVSQIQFSFWEDRSWFGNRQVNISGVTTRKLFSLKFFLHPVVLLLDYELSHEPWVAAAMNPMAAAISDI